MGSGGCGGAVLLVLLLLQLGWASGLRFDLSTQAPKCLSEDIHSQVLVLANYKVISDGSAPHNVSVKVTSPYGTPLHNAESVESGQFGFTTTEAGNYVACFWIPASEKSLILHIELDWKIGVAARDWDSVAKRDKIEGVEVELMRLQGAVEGIHETLVYMREREKQMRNVNEHTNARVAWYGIASLSVCLAVTGWQLWHLKSFFERKKLL